MNGCTFDSTALPATDGDTQSDTDEIHFEDSVKAMVEGERLHVRVPALSHRRCVELAAQIRLHPEITGYKVAPDIGVLGPTYFDTVGSSDDEMRYFDNAVPAIRAMRSAFHRCGGSPIDALRLQLDEDWPFGARLLRSTDGRVTYAGAARIFGEGSEARPHTDRIDWDAPVGRFSGVPIAQIAVNFYLETAERGGELCLWSERPDRGEYERHRVPGDYSLDQAWLGSPDEILMPRQGELILMDAQRVHAVRPVIQGERVTLSCFILVFGLDRELLIYS